MPDDFGCAAGRSNEAVGVCASSVTETTALPIRRKERAAWGWPSFHEK